MIIVEASYRVKPGMRDKLLELCKANMEGSRKEPGNIAYTHYPSPDNDQDVFVFEKWESEEAFSTHSSTKHHQEFCKLRAPMLEPNTYQITFYNSEINQKMTDAARAFAKTNINPTM